jgi:hypothetical protein
MKLLERRTWRPIEKRVPTTDGRGFTSVVDALEDIWFDTEIDETKLVSLARKAAANKSGKSRVGPIVVTITKRVRKSA